MRPSSLLFLERLAAIAMVVTGLLAMVVTYHAATAESMCWFRHQWAVAVVLAIVAYGWWAVAVWCRQDRREQEWFGEDED